MILIMSNNFLAKLFAFIILLEIFIQNLICLWKFNFIYKNWKYFFVILFLDNKLELKLILNKKLNLNTLLNQLKSNKLNSGKKSN